MKSSLSAWKPIALIAVVHFTATFSLWAIPLSFGSSGASIWVGRALTGLSVALSLPVASMLHHRDTPIAGTIALTALNSVAAAAILWLAVLALKRAPSEARNVR